MQIEATIEKKLSIEKYTTKKGEEKQKQLIIVKTKENYPKLIALTIDPKAIELTSDNGVFSVNVESREFNGKWYTNIFVWKFEPKEPTKVEAPKVEDVKDEPNSDDLPF